MTKATTKPKPPQTDLLKSVQAVQLELDPLVTDGVNKFANMHRYATINNILSTLLPLLKKHDLYLVQKLAMVGDIKTSRVASSNLELLPRFGIEPILVAPEHFMPLENFRKVQFLLKE